MLEASVGSWLQTARRSLERNCGRANNSALMLFLCKENEVVTRAAVETEAIWKRDVNGLLSIPIHGRYPRQRTCNRNVLKQPSTVFSSQHV